MYLTPQGTGWIEVICGSMFSGKTEELIRRLRRAMIAQQNVRIFKPAIDRRYDEGDIVSHSEQRIPSRVVGRAEEILDHCPLSVQVVGIDEAQFFEPGLVEVCRELARRGVRVIVAGLEQDYRANPFDTIQSLIVEAEYVTKSLAICVICGNPAVRNQRLSKKGGQIVVGGSETYEARCRRCFRPGEDEPELFGGGGRGPRVTPRVLVVAGSDPLAYSGLQADMRHLDALSCRGAGVVTAWTEQTVDRILEVRPVDAASVRDGIAAAREAGPVDAVKVGMLHRAEVVDAVADALADVQAPIVVDPVLDAGGGGGLLDDGGRDALRARLFPLATLVTPNLPELLALGPAAEDLLALGAGAVLVTGGHAEGAELVDVLVTADGVRSFEGHRVSGVAPRGTGCALTTAIAALLARGGCLGSSVESAIRSVRAAVAACAARGTRLLVLD